MLQIYIPFLIYSEVNDDIYVNMSRAPSIS